MKYKLIGSNDYLIDPITCILNNRGIENTEQFLKLTESVVHDYKLLLNIDKAVECVKKHIENNNEIMIIVDADADGNTSAALMYNYLKKVNSKQPINFLVHSGKEHGFSDEIMDKITDDIKLVICPDAGSNDINYHKLLKDRGVDVLVLDHHQCDKYSKHAIVVNNQMCDYPNKMLSGVGIVYKLCKALDDELGYYGLADEFLDLVALGLTK